MRRLFRPVKRTVYFVWICRHMAYHMLIGLVYAWALREIWDQFSLYHISLSVFGSIVMDADHVVYYFVYGRNESYARQVREFLRGGRIITLARYITSNHKNHTQLWSHNIYVTGGLLLVSTFSFLIDFETGVVLFGAMALHLLFDIADDFLILGQLNANWRHWGRSKLE